jgi:ribose transport system permease protein
MLKAVANLRGDRVRSRSLVRNGGLIAMFVGMDAVFTVLSPYFLTANNQFIIGANASWIGVMALAQTAAIVSGGFDLSVGAAMALTGAVIAVLSNLGVNIFAAAALGLLVGPVAGLANGLLIARYGINPLITTLGTLSIMQGLAFSLSEGLAVILPDEGFSFFGRGYLGPVPVSLVIFLALTVVAVYVMSRTTLGRYIYAIGGNRDAAELAGIPVKRVQILVYMISGTSAAIAGVIVASLLGAAAPQTGQTANLTVITAVILGGTTLAGGRGTPLGTVLGVLILASLSNGLILLNISSFLQLIAQGLALIIAVGLDVWSRRGDPV